MARMLYGLKDHQANARLDGHSASRAAQSSFGSKTMNTRDLGQRIETQPAQPQHREEPAAPGYRRQAKHCGDLSINQSGPAV
jgi:hypothetical protein